MREIKFRGKSTFNNQNWVYGSFALVDDTPSIISESMRWEDGSEMSLNDWSYIHEETLGQFTRLKDKNGKEIYEGDILMCIGQRADNKGRKYYRKVLFDNGSFCMTVPEYKMLSPLRDHVVDGKLGWEVIGNIYDNPELIKKED